jgi:hypothetical protein
VTFKVSERNKKTLLLLVKCLLKGTENMSTGLSKVPKQKVTKHTLVEKYFLAAIWNCVPEII